MIKNLWRWLRQRATCRHPLLFAVSFMTLFLVAEMGYGSMRGQPKFNASELTAIDGVPVAWPAEGKYAIVFFATWCEDCRRVYGHIADFKRRHPGLPIYGLALEDDPDTLQAWLRRRGNPFTQVAIINSTQAYYMGVAQVPRALLVEKQTLIARARELHPLWPLDNDNAGK